MLVIALGISSLVMVITAINVLQGVITEEFRSMGANSFTIRNRGMIRLTRNGQKPRNFPEVSYLEAREFQERYTYPSEVGLSVRASFNATVRYKSDKTNPNVSVMGANENYLATAGYDIESGRNFIYQEIENNAHVAIIGQEIATKLFEFEDPLGKVIGVGNGKYRIVGVLEKKGSSMTMGGDRLILLPISNVRQHFSQPNMNYSISVLTGGPQHMDPATSEAFGIFRIIRKVPLQSDPNFEITRSDSLASVMMEMIDIVTIVGLAITLFTLFGAAIGLMNIMLVSVKERTREIGTRKSVGAKASTIGWQFLVEAVLICQLGGVAGIVLGLGLGNLSAFFFEASFVVPWVWIIVSISVCFLVGLAAGVIPALKAAALDPIEALRYE